MPRRPSRPAGSGERVGDTVTQRRAYEETGVEVAGGRLSVPRWPADRPDAPVVVALHGITANGLSWARVADHLAGRVTLLAPDLRGRGRSGTLPGPFGIDAHCADVAAVAAASGAGPVVLAGHSMGAFLAATAAVRSPGTFPRVVLADGGVGFPLPPGPDPDEVITAVIGPAMRRLTMTFATPDAYLDHWREHPAFAGTWAPWVEEYILRDLAGRTPELRSACSLQAVRTDGMAQFGPEVLAAATALPASAVLLMAERGLMDEPQALYDEERLALAGIPRAPLRTRAVPGTNHYTLLTSDTGAREVAAALLEAAGL